MSYSPTKHFPRQNFTFYNVFLSLSSSIYPPRPLQSISGLEMNFRLIIFQMSFVFAGPPSDPEHDFYTTSRVLTTPAGFIGVIIHRLRSVLCFKGELRTQRALFDIVHALLITRTSWASTLHNCVVRAVNQIWIYILYGIFKKNTLYLHPKEGRKIMHNSSSRPCFCDTDQKVIFAMLLIF